MQLTPRNFLKILELKTRLSAELNKTRPSLKVLARVDETGTFAAIQEIAAGLKLNQALRGIKRGTRCEFCKVNLAQSRTCNVCLGTQEGRAFSKALYGEASKKFQSEFSAEKKADISRRRRQTNQERYGGPAPICSEEVRIRTQETWARLHGGPNPSYGSGVRQKRRQTTRKRLGVDHFLQDPESFHRYQRRRFKYYDVQLGERQVQAQGSAEVAFVAYMNENYRVREASDKPTPIWYRNEGKRSRYHADFQARVKGEKFLFEVKSPFTLTHFDWERNLAKFRAANRWCRRREIKFVLVLVVKDHPNFVVFPTKRKIEQLLNSPPLR